MTSQLQFCLPLPLSSLVLFQSLSPSELGGGPLDSGEWLYRSEFLLIWANQEGDLSQRDALRLFLAPA